MKKSNTLLTVFIVASNLFAVQSFHLAHTSSATNIKPFTTSESVFSSPLRTVYGTSSTASTPRSSTSLSAVPLDVVISFYKQSLLENPLDTKLATGGILALIGDAIAQSRDPTEYDARRAGAFVAFDMLYRAVQCSLFPEITSICDGHYLGTILPGVDTTILSTLEQTMTNQFLVIPLIYYPVFFSLTGYVQGLSKEATMQRVQTTIGPLLLRNWLFWIPVQYFQFGYVDEPLQIPFLCVVGLAWTFILSIAAGSVEDYESATEVAFEEIEGEQVVS
jgi:hypothetical protein